MRPCGIVVGIAVTRAILAQCRRTARTRCRSRPDAWERRLRVPTVITGYRSDLDGLRTVAVYLVLLFHAGLGWFAGGFIGVDVFFCLSGFLVSSLLIGELQESGSLRLGRFYSRRIRRLLPAAVVVVVATGLVFTLLWSVVRRASLVADAVSALLYYANLHFMVASGDYFAANVDKSPFLHFWSLSIEEQFYAFFPVLLVLLFRVRGARGARWSSGSCAAMLVVSLADPGLLRPERPEPGLLRHRHAPLPAAGGSALLTAPGPDHLRLPARRPSRSRWSAWPGSCSWAVGCGTWARRPRHRATVATVLLLGGLAQARARPAVPVLATRPMAYLGRISYGTYLWHWPVILALTDGARHRTGRGRGDDVRTGHRPRGTLLRASGDPDPPEPSARCLHLAGGRHRPGHERARGGPGDSSDPPTDLASRPVGGVGRGRSDRADGRRDVAATRQARDRARSGTAAGRLRAPQPGGR